MSWDGYIDNMMGHAPGNVDRACIIGLDGGAPWTTDAHANAFKLTPTEASNIARCMKSKDLSSFQTGGIGAEGVKYQYLREMEGCRIALGKKKDHGSITVQASKTAVVIGHCPEGGQPGLTNKAVNTIAEYLEGLGM